MFSFLLPKHVKQGRQLLKDAKKLLAYKRDIWSEATVADYEAHLQKLDAAVKSRDARGIEEEAHKLDAICAANLPAPANAWLAENVEVFLVAIVIALGVRTYFLQPFTIPTGSMQPTLNGVIGYPTIDPPPNILVRTVQTGVFGRSWLNAVAQGDESVVAVEEFTSLAGIRGKIGFTRTEIRTTKAAYVVPGMRETVVRYFLKPLGYTYKAGEPIARGYIDTGDHVFVDKFTYHFRKPKRAEVFVFNTEDVPTNENARNPLGMLRFEIKGFGPFGIRGPVDPTRGSQFYIKRLAGLPGDELRIDPPKLFINGTLATEAAFLRVMSAQDGYRGYSNGPEGGRFDKLGYPDIPYTVPAKNYFALGDNSFHSSDSRDWGPVPQDNLMGRGVFVYWPFGRHWGLIK
jgi:signal peptidase I